MNIIPFDFSGNAVRVVEHADQPWFLAHDVCQILGTASRDVRKIVDADEVDTIHLDSGSRGTLVLTESGLYHLIFKSRKVMARRFRKWVTSEVLPSIRRTGKYAVNEPIEPADAAERATIPAFLRARGQLTFDELIYYGARVRLLSQSLGVSYEFERDDHLGRVRSYARPILEMAWTQLLKKRERTGLQLDLFIKEEEAA